MSSTEFKPGLGRVHAPDERDRNYLLGDVLPPVSAGLTRRYWWDNTVWLDQGATGTCVGHGWAHWLSDSPVTDPGITSAAAFGIYNEASRLDPWPDNDGDVQAGTTVRAGAQAIVNRGRMREYRWAFDLSTVINALLTTGPVVLGIDWYHSMFDPRWVKDAAGTYRWTIVVDQASGLAGGHCLVANGVNVPARTIRLKNSWGRGWGADGRVSISFDDLALLLSSRGEACAAIEAPHV